MKNRVAYSKDHREQAKRENKGLMTVSYVDTDGSTVTLQGVTNQKQLDFVKDALAKLVGME